MSIIKRFVLAISLIMSTLTLFSQTEKMGSIKGRVIDANTKKALEFVNVSIRVAGTTPPLTGTITDSTGVFHLGKIKNGTYILAASFIGYRTAEKEFTISSSTKNINLKNISLEEDSKVLNEIQVLGQKSLMRLEIDKKVFDVASSIAQSGGSASDILSNIPSVEVDNEGEISLRGNSSVTIWINGKASGLTADNQAQILEQIPAESIERIEVITNPSAKFSPEGTSGIINIILKKDRKAGYYGSIQVGGDVLGGYNSSANINYNYQKIETYANIGYRKRVSEGGEYTNRTNIDEAGNDISYLNQTAENDRNNSSIFARTGITYNITPNDHLSLDAFGHFGKRESDNSIHYESNIPGSFTNSERLSHSKNSANGGEISLDYKHEFSENSNLIAHVSWDCWNSEGTNTFRQYSIFPNNTESSSWQKQKSDNRSNSWEFQIDYVTKFSKHSKLETGYKGSIGKQNSPIETYSGASEETATPDEQLYNRFIYNRDIHALYATYAIKINNFGLQAGLRGEHTGMYTKSLGFHQSKKDIAPYKDDDLDLFPSVFLSYSLPRENEIQINYTRRISRPRGYQVNPFLNMTDSINISFGNPYLTPEYSNSYELNYIKTWTKHTLSLSVYYRTTDDVIQRIRYREGNVMKSTFANITQTTSIGSEIVAKNKLTPFLDLTSTLNLYYNELDGFSYLPTGTSTPVTGDRDNDFSWNARVITNIILPYAISLQATGKYDARRIIAQGSRKASHSIDMGIRKSFLDKKLNLNVSAQDILNSQSWNSQTSGAGFRQDNDSWRKGRMYKLSLTYNFGNTKASKKQQQNKQEEMNSMEEEF